MIEQIKNIELFFSNYIKKNVLLNKITNKYNIDKYIIKDILKYIFDDEIITEYYILKRIYKKALTKEKFSDWISGTFYHYCMYNKKINKSLEPFYYGSKIMIKSIEFSKDNILIDQINSETLYIWNELMNNKTSIELDENHKIISIKIYCYDIKGEISDEIWKLKHIKEVRLQHIKNRNNFNSLADKLPIGVVLSD